MAVLATAVAIGLRIRLPKRAAVHGVSRTLEFAGGFVEEDLLAVGRGQQHSADCAG